MKTLEEIKKEIQELQFAINPTETKGVLWKWTKHGLDILSLYVESTISQTKQELIEEIKEWSEYRRKNITGASVIESGKVLDKGSLFYDGYNQTIDELEEFLQKLSNK